MPISIVGGKVFLIVTHGVRFYADSFSWSENVCSLLYVMLIATHGGKLNAHCYTWSEALCSLLYME